MKLGRGGRADTNGSAVMAAEEEVAEGWKVYYQDRAEGSRELTLRIAAIKEIVLRRLAGALHATEILTSGDVDETMRGAFEMLQLYQWLEEPATGIRIVASLVQKYAARSLDLIASSPSALDFRFAVKTGKVGDFARGLASWCRTEAARAGLCPELLRDATQIIPERILHEGQAALLTIVRTFSHERNLYPTVSARISPLRINRHRPPDLCDSWTFSARAAMQPRPLIYASWTCSSPRPPSFVKTA